MNEHLKLDEKQLNKIIEQYAHLPGQIMSTLEAIQEAEGYVPKNTLVYVSDRMGVPLSQLYSVVTFYAAFSLKPRGKNIITLCEGTSCHVRGGPRLLSALHELLAIKAEERHEKSVTTPDRLFTIEKTRCLGCCSLAPVVKVNDDIYGYVTPQKLPEILKKYEWHKK